MFAADHATELSVQALLGLRQQLQGAHVVEVGCGTAVNLAVAARLGAGRLSGSDIVPEACALARRTLADLTIPWEIHAGDLFTPYAVSPVEPFDVLVANLPQKPTPAAGLLHVANDGGRDGIRVLEPFVRDAAWRLRPGSLLQLFLHTLGDNRVWALLGEHFDLSVRTWRRRHFTREEMTPIWPRLQELRDQGRNHFLELARNGSYCFHAMVVLATRRAGSCAASS
jgi:methylase of polypeptide subunit release factors